MLTLNRYFADADEAETQICFSSNAKTDQYDICFMPNDDMGHGLYMEVAFGSLDAIERFYSSLTQAMDAFRASAPMYPATPEGKD